MGKRPCISKEPLNRGAWTAQEDQLLRDYITLHGQGKWSKLPQRAGLKRCGKGCRLRWLNYLRPNIKRGNISKEEEDLIIRLHNLLGNRWSLIAGRIPNRTDNEIKNYWNTYLAKRVRDRHNSNKNNTSSTTTSTEEVNNNNATSKLQYSHSNNVFRTKASKCSKSLIIDAFPVQKPQQQSQTADPEDASLLLNDSSPNTDNNNNNNISGTNNEILSSWFPSEEEEEISMDMLFDCDLGDVCFSDLLNLDFLDTCDLGSQEQRQQ